jgi:hypothetical protein
VATNASAAAPPKGTVHVVYIANSTVDQTVNDPDSPTTASEKLNWNVSADIPLAAASTVPYRYSKNFSGTVDGDGTFKGTAFSCGGKLSIAETNQEQAGTFELDLVKSGGTLTSKAKLGAESPVPEYTTDFGQFAPDSGPSCAGSQVIHTIQSGPSPAGPHPVVVKLDLAKLASAKGKTQRFKVGKTDNVTRGTTTTKYDWSGTITLTLTK